VRIVWIVIESLAFSFVSVGEVVANLVVMVDV
jgi:hypothetical protein